MAILKCVPPISYRQVFSRLYYLANECAWRLLCTSQSSQYRSCDGRVAFKSLSCDLNRFSGNVLSFCGWPFLSVEIHRIIFQWNSDSEPLFRLIASLQFKMARRRGFRHCWFKIGLTPQLQCNGWHQHRHEGRWGRHGCCYCCPGLPGGQVAGNFAISRPESVRVHALVL